ncbi:hypothetical protein [Polyangium aurulentum]|uniref:hypothetical protein n=1 Tax=Polyangium aurulentum TaxID=2567896 RepID=UPI0010AEBB63|nr:hypothetical protein [Polyangium aurulentum]
MATTAPAARTNSNVAVVTPAEPPTGRLAVLTAAALAVGAIPIPFVPDRLAARVRGAIVHDITARHGLSLTSDARKILAEPDPRGGGRALARKAAEAISMRLIKRAFAPAGILAAAAGGLEVYALGHLLERYFTRTRRTGAVRIQIEEARKIRDIIDRSLVRALSPSLQPASLNMSDPIEDLRDEVTRWIDTALLTGATLPSYIERRLEAAFDEIASSAT